MIIDVWRPKIRKINGKGFVTHYEIVDTESFLKEKKVLLFR